MIGSYSTERIIREIVKLQSEEFLGVCKILGVKLVNDDKPRDFNDIWADVTDKVENLNRIQRKVLTKLLRAANTDR